MALRGFSGKRGIEFFRIPGPKIISRFQIKTLLIFINFLVRGFFFTIPGKIWFDNNITNSNSKFRKSDGG